MKRPLRIFFPFILSAFYCLAVSGFLNGGSLPVEYNSENKATDAGVFLLEKDLSANLFAIQEGNQPVVSNNTFPGSVKQQDVFNVAIQARETQRINSFSRYQAHIFKCPIRIRKADMLFPFHYFF